MYCSPESPIVIPIEDYNFCSFFEFLRFLYTDDVNITIQNVKDLVFLVDDFKVAGLEELCINFLRKEINPNTVLKIMAVTQTFMKKAIVSLWRDVVERLNLLNRFRELTLVERKSRMAAITKGGSKYSSSKPGSVAASPMSTTQKLRSAYAASRGTSQGGSQSSLVSGCRDSYVAETVESGGVESVADLAGATIQDVYQLMDQGTSRFSSLIKRSQQLYYELAKVSQEIDFRCWRCIREETDAVLNSEDWVLQDIRMVRRVLRLDMCSVPEVVLFRAVNKWAEHKCRSENVHPLPEFRRKALGEDTIDLIRFPLLSLEELQWEVVPTGIIGYEDVQQLQTSLARRQMNVGRFGCEPRHELSKASSTPGRVSEVNVMTPTSAMKGARPAPSTNTAPEDIGYAPLPDDPVDRVLASQLLRGFVDEAVEENLERNDAHEAGVPYVGAGSQTRQLVLKKSILYRDFKDFKKSILSREDNLSTCSTACGTGMSASPELNSTSWTPEVGWSSELQEPPRSSSRCSERPRSGHSVGRALPGVALPTLSAPTHHQALLQERFSATNSPMVLGTGQGPVPPLRRPETPRGAPQPVRPAGPPTGRDFQRVSPGLYRFRGERLVEIRLESGEAMVYEHGDRAASPGGDLDSDEERLRELGDEEVRKVLGIRENPCEIGVPLAAFLCRGA